MLKKKKKIKNKTKLNITLENLEVRKTTLQQKRKQKIDLDFKNQDDCSH